MLEAHQCVSLQVTTIRVDSNDYNLASLRVKKRMKEERSVSHCLGLFFGPSQTFKLKKWDYDIRWGSYLVSKSTKDVKSERLVDRAHIKHHGTLVWSKE